VGLKKYSPGLFAVRHALFDVLNVAAEHISTGAELELTLGALVPHSVALVRALEFYFAGRGEAESLRCGLFGFLFWHGFLTDSPKRLRDELAISLRRLTPIEFRLGSRTYGSHVHERIRVCEQHPLKFSFEEIANLLKRPPVSKIALGLDI
jgi:hypothetical protein